MDRELSLKEALEYIDPSSLDYQDWVGIGMGLKEAVRNALGHGA